VWGLKKMCWQKGISGQGGGGKKPSRFRGKLGLCFCLWKKRRGNRGGVKWRVVPKNDKRGKGHSTKTLLGRRRESLGRLGGFISLN